MERRGLLGGERERRTRRVEGELWELGGEVVRRGGGIGEVCDERVSARGTCVALYGGKAERGVVSEGV